MICRNRKCSQRFVPGLRKQRDNLYTNTDVLLDGFQRARRFLNQFTVTGVHRHSFTFILLATNYQKRAKKKKRQQIDPTNRHCVCRQSPVQRMLPCLGGISLLSKNLFSRGQIPSSQLTRPAKESETTRENCVAVRKCVAQLQL